MYVRNAADIYGSAWEWKETNILYLPRLERDGESVFSSSNSSGSLYSRNIAVERKGPLWSTSGECRTLGDKDLYLKGKFPQTTMWIGWVESKFTNPTVKVCLWADLDNPCKRSDYAKLCMSPSLGGTLPEYVISQEDNSPLTLYIDFHKISFFLDINSPVDQVQS